MRVVPALAGDTPKYVGDVWAVEKIDYLGRHGGYQLLGVFDTLAGAQQFSSTIVHGPNYSVTVSKTAFYTTKWSDTNEE